MNKEEVYKIKKLNEISEKDLIWLAGFIDGDGSILIGRQKAKKTRKYVHYYLHFVITQKSRKILDYIRNLIGAGSVNQHKTWTKCYYYTLTGDKASILLKQLLPYLKIKKFEAQIAVQFQDNKILHRGNFKPVPDNEIIWREMHYQLLRHIKSRRKE